MTAMPGAVSALTRDVSISSTRRLRNSLLGGFGLAVVTATGCTRESPPGEWTFHRGLSQLPVSRDLDPVLQDDTWSTLVALQVRARLFSVDNDGRLVPDLAISYRTTGAGTVHTICLDPTRRFSDGTPVTAEDVAFSLRRAASPGLNQATAFVFDRVAGYSRCPAQGLCEALSIRPTAAGCIEIKTVESVRSFPLLLTGVQTAVTKRSAAGQPDLDAYSGHYRIQRFDSDLVALERNPYLPLHPRAPTGIEFHIEEEEVTFRHALAGKRSFARVITPQDIELAEKSGFGDSLASRLTSTFYFVVLPALDPRSFERSAAALCQTVDADLLDSVYGPSEQPTETILPTALAIFKEPEPLNPCSAIALHLPADVAAGEPPLAIRIPDVMSGAQGLATAFNRSPAFGRWRVRAKLASSSEWLSEYVTHKISSPLVLGFAPAYPSAEAILRQWALSDLKLFDPSPAVLLNLRHLGGSTNRKDQQRGLRAILADASMQQRILPLMEERLTYVYDPHLADFEVSHWGDYYMNIAGYHLQ